MRDVMSAVEPTTRLGWFRPAYPRTRCCARTTIASAVAFRRSILAMSLDSAAGAASLS